MNLIPIGCKNTCIGLKLQEVNSTVSFTFQFESDINKSLFALVNCMQMIGFLAIDEKFGASIFSQSTAGVLYSSSCCNWNKNKRLVPMLLHEFGNDISKCKEFSLQEGYLCRRICWQNFSEYVGGRAKESFCLITKTFRII